ncbi:hypothetical protein FRAAL4311 [Frankia alni ACN14a]|uniref:Uncharacterized protein n=1 Tax=Frankia alni (strain DSM 45986 / CECT 9034 / ACN14a) TaxID=326424 RepID=Q0RHS0_FRAAA|nr:hypothetical protein FRAAL4311 [Frankia alni ACN14a]
MGGGAGYLLGAVTGNTAPRGRGMPGRGRPRARAWIRGARAGRPPDRAQQAMPDAAAELLAAAATERGGRHESARGRGSAAVSGAARRPGHGDRRGRVGP